MNNKEFLKELSNETGYTLADVSAFSENIIETITSHLTEEDLVSIYTFGTFEVKKKLERVVVNPATKQKMLIPPKIVVNFKPYSSLKDKANNK